MKINKQLRMLMLKKEEKKNVDELLRIAAIAEIIVDHCHLERKSKVYIRSPNKTAENISETKNLLLRIIVNKCLLTENRGSEKVLHMFSHFRKL